MLSALVLSFDFAGQASAEVLHNMIPKGFYMWCARLEAKGWICGKFAGCSGIGDGKQKMKLLPRFVVTQETCDAGKASQGHLFVKHCVFVVCTGLGPM